MNTDRYLAPDGTQPDWLREFIRTQKHIEAALEYNAGTHDLSDVLHAIAIGEMQLWAGEDSVIISQVVVYPRKKVLHLPFVGGNLAELERMEPTIQEFARFLKCDLITSAGRKGWERSFLKELGYKPVYNVMAMEIAP